jgi:hypothetical protein
LKSIFIIARRSIASPLGEVRKRARPAREMRQLQANFSDQNSRRLSSRSVHPAKGSV